MRDDLSTYCQANIRVIGQAPGPRGTWDDVLQRGDHVNLGQLPQWYSIIQEAYGHTPLYLEGEDEEGHHAVLPSFVIRRRPFGAIVTSMPFLDTGGPYSTSPALAQTLVRSLLQEATSRGAHCLELRCTAPMDLPVSPIGDKVNLSLKLPQNPDQLWKHLDAKVRNQIRKAERSGLSIEIGHAEKLSDFYEPFVYNMRDLGSPVHALQFFQAIFRAFGDKARVVLVRKGTQAIGGLIALEVKDSMIVPWASSRREYLPLCPNMLLYWETIRAGCLSGVSCFHFGRSSRHSGTYRFKRQWGAVEEPLFWYTIPLKPHVSGQFSPASHGAAWLTSLWQRLPLGFTRWLGPRVRKYLTQ